MPRLSKVRSRKRSRTKSARKSSRRSRRTSRGSSDRLYGAQQDTGPGQPRRDGGQGQVGGQAGDEAADVAKKLFNTPAHAGGQTSARSSTTGDVTQKGEPSSETASASSSAPNPAPTPETLPAAEQKKKLIESLSNDALKTLAIRLDGRIEELESALTDVRGTAERVLVNRVSIGGSSSSG